MTHLSKKLDLTVQETSRHLSRLSEKRLIQKDIEGFYSFTPYGEQALKLLPGFEFLSKYEKHFTNHKTSCLPHGFSSRIGDLVNSTLTDDVLVALHNVENRIRDAMEYVWILSDQILMSSLTLLVEALKRGVSFKIIMPKDMTPPPGFTGQSELQFFEQAAMSNLMENRFIEKVDVATVMSEKEAGVTFPTLDARIDYGFGFVATDKLGHAWCRDLFLYYWERATKEIPDYLR